MVFTLGSTITGSLANSSLIAKTSQTDFIPVAAIKPCALTLKKLWASAWMPAYAVCHSVGGHKFYCDLSLNELQEQLPAPRFFRLNRQYILSHRFIRGFNRAENGKVIALLKEDVPFPSQISISRTKAPEF